MKNNALTVDGGMNLKRDAASGLTLVGRLFLATIFIVSGLGKLADPAGTIGYIGSAGLPWPTLAYAGTVVLELGGGLALAIGYYSRLAAIALALFSILAGVLFHADLTDQNQFIHLLKNLALAGGLLQAAAFGAGRFSLDFRRTG